MRSNHRSTTHYGICPTQIERSGDVDKIAILFDRFNEIETYIQWSLQAHCWWCNNNNKMRAKSAQFPINSFPNAWFTTLTVIWYEMFPNCRYYANRWIELVQNVQTFTLKHTHTHIIQIDFFTDFDRVPFKTVRIPLYPASIFVHKIQIRCTNKSVSL